MAPRSVTLLLGVLVSTLARVWAHPLCWYGPDGAPSHTYEPFFCADDPNGNCCSAAEELEVQERYNAVDLTGECADLHKEVVCGICLGFSAHLYERLGPDLGNLAPEDGMTFTNEFCESYVTACDSQLEFPSNYCDVHTGGEKDQYWSYPLQVDSTNFETGMQKAFKSLPASSLPDNPIAMHMTPDGTKWWVAGQGGEIKEFDAMDRDVSSAAQVMDIGKGHNFLLTFEQGLQEFAFHPEFTTNNLFYVDYTVQLKASEKGRSRISKFVYTEGNSGLTVASEEILSTSIPKGASIHNGGWLGFKPSDYANPTKVSYELYWVIGDGGPQQDATNKAQDPTNMHGSMMRVLVSSDPDITGYTIPDSNPFATSGTGLSEICAWGMRNPFKCSFDKVTDELYCGDVGQVKVEEVNIIECGNNYGWRRFEGDRCNDAVESDFPEPCSTVDRSPYTFPTFQYCHLDYDSNTDSDDYTGGVDICGDRTVEGSAIIGGYVYRGSKYEDTAIADSYIFHDFEQKSMHALAPSGNGWKPGTIYDSNQVNKIVTFAEDNRGELYVVEWFGDIYELSCGDMCNDAPSNTPGNVNNEGYTYQGCFTDEVDDRRITIGFVENEAMTIEMCASICSKKGTSFFALEYASECFCGADDTNLTGTSKACTTPCSGDGSQLCGGNFAMSIYSFDYVITRETADVEGSTLVGCLTDNIGARRLTLADTAFHFMTVEECSGFCAGHQATYYGLEWGVECFCGGEDTSITQASSSCNMPCGGDFSQTCGGNNAILVYKLDSMPSPSHPSSIDCFSDSRESRRLSLGSKTSDEMTLEDCSSFCATMDSTYFGTEWGKECFCGGDSIDLSGTSSGCNMECYGDSSQICGGYLSISVYTLFDTVIEGLEY